MVTGDHFDSRLRPCALPFGPLFGVPTSRERNDPGHRRRRLHRLQPRRRPARAGTQTRGGRGRARAARISGATSPNTTSRCWYPRRACPTSFSAAARKSATYSTWARSPRPWSETQTCSLRPTSGCLRDYGAGARSRWCRSCMHHPQPLTGTGQRGSATGPTRRRWSACNRGTRTLGASTPSIVGSRGAAQ